MSAVKIKNAILRALNVAIAQGDIPSGVVVSASLRDRRIGVFIEAAPFDVLKPERLRIGASGSIGYAISIGAGPEKDHTESGVALLAKVKEIATAISPKGLWFCYSSDCYRAQALRARAAQAAAQPAAVTA